MPNKQAKVRKQEKKKLNNYLRINGRTLNQINKFKLRRKKRNDS